MKHALIAGAVAAIGAVVTLAAQDDVVARARAINQRIITIDTHNDIDPRNFTADCNYTMRLTTQVNLPKMKEGGLAVSFMIVYVGQGDLTPAGYDAAYRAAIEKFDAVHRLTETIAPQQIELALSPADVTRIWKSGKKVAVIGVENGYPLGMDAVKRVKEFYDRGGRYLSLAHNGHNQLADSHTGEAGNEWKWGGISPLGRQVIEEMNRLGMMVDVSHPSKAAMLQAIGLSKAPVIASHSSVRKLANQSRNMDDEMLMAMKTNGGVVQINAVSSFVKAPEPRPQPATASAAGGGGRGRRGAAPETYKCPVEGSGATGPVAGPATVKDYVDHIDYAVKLIGIDHVGVASDFDGGGGVQGFNSAADAVNVTAELLRRGYTEDQIAKIWGGNLLRVWSDVEKVAKTFR